MLNAMGLGHTPIAAAYAGGVGGAGLGMSLGMAGGPMGYCRRTWSGQGYRIRQ